jgi:hypothetical protein
MTPKEYQNELTNVIYKISQFTGQHLKELNISADKYDLILQSFVGTEVYEDDPSKSYILTEVPVGQITLLGVKLNRIEQVR